LASHVAEPFVEVHPDDAEAYAIHDGGFARVSTAHGASVLRVIVSARQQPRSVFVPIHWSGETASAARVGELVSAQTDPHSGQPEAKATPAAIGPVAFASRGFLRTRDAVALPAGTWWARVAAANVLEFRLAADHGSMIWHDFASRCLAVDGSLAEYYDDHGYRAAAFVDGEIDGCISIVRADLPLLDVPFVFDAAELVEGRSQQAAKVAVFLGETEPVICACFSLAANVLRESVARGGVRTLVDVAQTFRAGTNCGSCIPELKRMLREHAAHTS
jgi:assimilatory nitrate reductase catalytic subunit